MAAINHELKNSISRAKIVTISSKYGGITTFAGKYSKSSRLATPFLPSHQPNLPHITDSPEGVANLLFGVANLLVTTVIYGLDFGNRRANPSPLKMRIVRVRILSDRWLPV